MAKPSLAPPLDPHSSVHDNGVAGDALQSQSEESVAFRAVFEAGPDPISISSLDDGAYLEVNRAFERLAGLGRQEILGRTPGELGFWPDPVSYEAFLDGVTHDGKIQEHPVEFHGKDRSVASTLVSAHVVGVNGRRCVLSFLHELTDVRVRERQAAEDVRQATESTATARDESRRILSRASHEIRAPLNHILGFSELLGETALTAEQRSYFEALERGGQELLTLVNNVLDVSKGENGGVELAAIEFDLGAIVEDTIRDAVLRAGEKDLEITGRLMPGVPNRVIGDPARFRQILTNLVQNAVKFTEKGRVSLIIDNDRSDVPGAVCCTVSDTGIGIPPEQLASIFDPFVQGDPASGRCFGGVGLGLAIAKQLVERMGGSVEVKSSEAGTHIGFALAFALPEKIVDTGPSLAGVEVLLIDSHAAERATIAATLRACGASVIEISDGAAALSELGRECVSPTERVILLDGRLPGANGFEIVKRLRGHEGLLDRIALLVPVQHRGDDLAELRGLGVGACLLKPVKSSELLGAVVARLGQKKAPSDS